MRPLLAELRAAGVALARVGERVVRSLRASGRWWRSARRLAAEVGS